MGRSFNETIEKTAAAATALSVCAALQLGLTTEMFAAKAVSCDFNGDGKFSLSDITGLLNAHVNGSKLDARTLSATDTDGNGKITLTDCIAFLKQYVNGGSGSSSSEYSGLAVGKDYAKGTVLRMGVGYNGPKTASRLMLRLPETASDLPTAKPTTQTTLNPLGRSLRA